MGLINPRPAMRGRERRTTENKLRLHSEFMGRLEAEGMSHEEASRKAFWMIKAGGKWIEAKDRGAAS